MSATKIKYDLYNPEPQGVERRQEVLKLLSSNEDNLLIMKKAIQLYIANSCDIDKLESREYDDDSRAKKSEAATGSMQADNAQLWALIDAKHRAMLSVKNAPIKPEFYLVFDDIANIATLVDNAIKQRKGSGSKTKVVEAPQEVIDVAVKPKTVEVSQEVMDMKVSDLLSSAKHKESLTKLITLVETGTAADLVAYVKEAKKEINS